MKRDRTDPQIPEEKPGVESWAPGKRILDHYVISKILGEGGMGTVYLACRETDNACFAVKTVISGHLRNRGAERLFIQELRTWIDLPGHPNLTACRFFRTIEDRLAIFSDYVDGGSLQEWIVGKKLLSLDSILDVAVQAAWGLHAAHEEGVIHQDVKPSNILVTDEGVAKITDFGLSRARHSVPVDEPFIRDSKHSVLISSSGMTLAYCSPEQAARQKINRRTDIWSWGLTVLEMFTGEVTWQVGAVANLVLKNIAARGAVPPYPEMPSELVDVLSKCFQVDPNDRWPNLLTVAHELQQIYRQYTGKEFPRPEPEFTPAGSAVKSHRQRFTAGGLRWDNPLIWLKKAFEAANRDLTDTDLHHGKWTGSRKAQVLLDLEIYSQALSIFTDLVSAGDRSHIPDLAKLSYNKALVHIVSDDVPGALKLCEISRNHFQDLATADPGNRYYHMDLGCAVKLMADLMDRKGDFQEAIDLYDTASGILKAFKGYAMDPEIQNCHTAVLLQKSSTLRNMGYLAQSNALLDQIIAITETFAAQADGKDFQFNLAVAYINKATLLRNLNEIEESVQFQEKAGIIFKRLAEVKNRDDLRVELAKTLATQGVGFFMLGRSDSALELMAQAAEILEKLVYDAGLSELSDFLAKVYVNQANILDKTGSSHAGLAQLDKAETIYKHLIYLEDRQDLTALLAIVYTNKGVALSSLGKLHQAADVTTKAVHLLEALEKREGKMEFAFQVSLGQMNLGSMLTRIDEPEKAIVMFDKSLERMGHLIKDHGMSNLRNRFAEILANKAEAELKLDNLQSSRELFHRAIEIRETLVFVENRHVNARDLAGVYLQKAVVFVQQDDLQAAHELGRKAIELLEKFGSGMEDAARTELLEKARKLLI